VLDAYRKGDFSARMPNDLLGLPGKVADTLNDIIDRGVETTTEFGRVAQLVGKQGKLDERIKLPNMKGSWAKLVDSSNALANDLVSPMNEMIRVVSAVAKGDFRPRGAAGGGGGGPRPRAGPPPRREGGGAGCREQWWAGGGRGGGGGGGAMLQHGTTHERVGLVLKGYLFESRAKRKHADVL